MRTINSTILGFAILLAALSRAHPASLVFSANDQQSGYSQSGMFVVSDPKPGSLTAVDFSVLPPRITSKLDLPCSVIGPPSCLAASRNGDAILLAGAMRVDPKSPGELAPDRSVTLLRWTPRGLEQKDQIEIGPQPSGVALSGDGQRAFVTLRAEGKIAVLDLRNGKIRLEKSVAVARPEDSLSHIVLAPDGKTALATLYGKNVVLVLNADLEVVQELTVGKGPYDACFLPDSAHAFVGCTLANAVFPISLRGGEWHMGEPIPVDRFPEGVDASPDGKWLLASCLEPADSSGPIDPDDGKPGSLRIFRIGPDAALAPFQTIEIAGLPQGAVFVPDSQRIVAGDFGHGKLLIYKLRGSRWEEAGAPIEVPGQPAALAITPESTD